MLHEVINALQFLLPLAAGRQYAVASAADMGMASLHALALTYGYYAASSYGLARRAERSEKAQAKFSKAKAWEPFGVPVFGFLVHLRPGLRIPALVVLTLLPLGFLIVLAALIAWSYSLPRLMLMSATLNTLSYAVWDKGLGELMERFAFVTDGLRLLFVVAVLYLMTQWVVRRYRRQTPVLSS